MTSLSVHLDRYLKVRRSLGYDLSTSERILRRFAAFAESEGADYVTADLFLRWRVRFGSADTDTWAARLGIVRQFTLWMQGIDPRNEVPPADLIHGRPRRARPFIYTEQQIAEIVAAAGRLPSAYGLRAQTSSTLFGLIAVTGLRVSEAIGLDDGDVDLENAVLTIQKGKNGRSRLVPVAACVAHRLAAYRTERNRLMGTGQAAFFLAETGRRPTDCGARYTFAQVCQTIGLRPPQAHNRHGRGPRIHDLRHTFAVRTITAWYRKGLDPDREMIKLSTYLGHQKPEFTYWYIEAVPELLQLASERAANSIAQGVVQ